MARKLTGDEQGAWHIPAKIGLAFAVSILLAMYAWVLVAVPDKLFADDSYFYFQVAWNFARGMGSTFNGIMPTNGYHPLWMLLLACLYRFFPAKDHAIHAVGGLIALLNILMLWTVRQVLKRVARDLWPLAFVLLIPFSFLSQLGTEGALSGFLLALLMLLAYQVCQPGSGPKTFFLYNLVAALAVLSRLDNIFIVSFVWLGVWLALDKARRRLQLVLLPVYLLLWGTYLASNWFYFHTIQPISGILKSGGKADHALGANLPHTALFALAVISVCMIVMTIMQRDLFYRVVEVPFALGVLCHAAYIVLRMSSETRWSWYYTSWILLAAVMAARAGSVILTQKNRLALPVQLLCVLVLAGAWIKLSYKKFYLGPDVRPPASFNETVYGKAGIRRAFAYDQPGMLAYYSDVAIVPLDGLMGNLQFQHDLATKGVQAVMADEQIDGFIGPPEPLKPGTEGDFCPKVFLWTEQFHCVPDGKSGWNVTAVDIYARVPSKLAGTISLLPQNLVWDKPDFVAVWRVASEPRP